MAEHPPADAPAARTTALLGVGERAPDFALPRPDGTAVRFYATAGGRPAVLVFCSRTDGPAATAAARAVSEVGDQDGPTLHLVAREHAAPGAEALIDAEGRVHALYRVDPDAPVAVYALDANLRVLAAHAGLVDAAWLRQALAPLGPPPPGEEVRAQAPVLYVPRVLDPATCHSLMTVWETQGNTDTGVERSAGGRREDALNPSAKRRRDHTVSDPALLRSLTAAIGRRLMPELRKAFAYRATRFEGFKIACYDADLGGFFTAHRDNLSPATAHRRFALTLNLNDGYEGGHLRFPEYGPQRYRPAAGEALVFSCSHLHEVLPVTGGRRFVLLSFLFGEEQARTGA